MDVENLFFSIEEFEKVVADVIENLPQEFSKHLENILIVVEDAPSEEQTKLLHLRKYVRLFGLYQGIPLNFPGRDRMVRTPDTITIFRRAILSAHSDPESVKSQIRSTMLHEIGHYFGMSERELSAMGKKYR